MSAATALPRWLDGLFSSDGFMPHGHCYLWNPGLVALHVGSDALTALAYASIPFTLLYVARRRRDVPFRWMFLCFGVFIVACGATHAMEIWTLWTPTYWIAGTIKAVTAAASVATAVLLARLVPRILALPTSAQLAAAHDALRDARDLLEQRVVERTAELDRKNRQLQREMEERRRAETAVATLSEQRAAETKFRTLVDNLPNGGVLMFDHDLRYTLVRGRGFAEVGLTQSAEGKTVHEVFPPEMVATGEATLRDVLRGNGSVADVRYGERTYLLHRVPVRKEDGDVVAGMILAQDITARVEAEAALREAKESAELANRELESFSYSVAHDLRAPLRAVNGFARILVDEHRGQLNADAVECLDEIQGGARRMGELIDALLSLSRVTRGGLRRERVDLAAVARSIASALSVAEPGRQVEVVIESDLGADVDLALARTLLENLLGNAWKFSGKAAAPRIEVGAERKDEATVFFVRDNGAGFDMAHAEKLFATFQRLHAASEFPGTGIGLATVQRIVHRHGGRIWAEGVVGKGATFHFTLSGPNGEGGRG